MVYFLFGKSKFRFSSVGQGKKKPVNKDAWCKFDGFNYFQYKIFKKIRNLESQQYSLEADGLLVGPAGLLYLGLSHNLAILAREIILCHTSGLMLACWIATSPHSTVHLHSSHTAHNPPHHPRFPRLKFSAQPFHPRKTPTYSLPLLSAQSRNLPTGARATFWGEVAGSRNIAVRPSKFPEGDLYHEWQFSTHTDLLVCHVWWWARKVTLYLLQDLAPSALNLSRFQWQQHAFLSRPY